MLDILKPPIEAFQEFVLLSIRAVRNIFRSPHYADDIFIQMDVIGVGSLFIVSLIGLFSGIVMALQMSRALTQYGAQGQVGSIVSITLVRELGPVLTAVLVAGRNASGIASELGSMKVTEQIDAIEASAVNSFKLLVVTRVVACILMLPLLTIVADFSGILVGWMANTLIEHVSLMRFLEDGFKHITFLDLIPATVRTAVFGFIIGLLGCFQGMRTSGGTEGVARSATSAVVLSSLFVILADVGLVRLIQVVFKP